MNLWFYDSIIVPRSHTGKPPSVLSFIFYFLPSLHLLLLKIRLLTSVWLLILSQKVWKPQKTYNLPSCIVYISYFMFPRGCSGEGPQAYRCWFGIKALSHVLAWVVVPLLPLLTCLWLSIYYGLHWSFSPLHSHTDCLLIILGSIA